MQIQVPQNLNTARAALNEGMQRQTAKVNDIAQDIAKMGLPQDTAQQAAAPAENNNPEATQIASANSEALTSAQESPDLAQNLVGLLEAKTAYKAAAEATQVVNDVQQQSIETVDTKV